MNYLAHAFLSPPDSQILLGNMACDMIRPEDKKMISESILKGMTRHQEIDRFTDRHRGFVSVRDLLNSQKLPYAGVFTDIIFDHSLARSWNNYSKQSLRTFSDYVYNILDISIKENSIPGHFPRLAAALVKDDWFVSYSFEEGLEKALYRLNYRSSKDIPVDKIMDIVKKDSNCIDSGFTALMKDLVNNFPHAL